MIDNITLMPIRRESKLRLRLAESDASKLRTRLRMLEQDASTLRARLRMLEEEMDELRDRVALFRKRLHRTRRSPRPATKRIADSEQAN